MPEDDLIDLAFDQHLITCPHCHQQTVHPWSGTIILFSPAKCSHCGQEFVIALNQPRPKLNSRLTTD
jgi:transposase-like protein